MIPVITTHHPDVLHGMSVQIRGSYGLGIADEYSDLDAVLWLDDPIWKQQGGNVQLTLEHDVPRFGPSDTLSENGHPEVSVWPLSWLGARMKFLNDNSEMAWEEVSFEDLFEIQRNLVLRDPKGIFQKLRDVTSPSNFP